MRPYDVRYNAIPLPEAPGLDATVAYVATRSPISDTYARFQLPMLIMQGALDDNVLPEMQEKFAATYKAAGGDISLTVFEDCEHQWVARPGPQTNRAREMVKAFIAKNLTEFRPGN
jgi:alpha-beta hydrolase superfamily lysophospholipase